MDRLSYEAKRAMDAGMSYGKWKALHPVSDYDQPARPKPATHYAKKETNLTQAVCAECGGTFSRRLSRQRFCCRDCCQAYGNREYKRRKSAQ